MAGNDKIFSPEEAAVIVESVSQSINAVDAKLRNINLLMVGVIMVLFIGFATMILTLAGIVLDAWRYKSNSYEGLIETIRSQEKVIIDNKTQQSEINTLLENIQKELQKQKTVGNTKK